MKKISTLFICLCILFTMEAQVFPSFRFRHYTVEDGLNANSVRSLLQSRQGYIWVGTESGLNRFDGIAFKDYSVSGPENPGSHSVNAMMEDETGAIWLATDIGIYSFSPDKDRFHKLRTESNTGTTVSSIVYGIARDKEMNLWFATYGQGVFKYNPKTATLIQYEIPGCSNNIYSIYADSDNTVWVTGSFSLTPAIYRLNRNTNTFDEFRITARKDKGFSNGLSICEDSSGSLWVGTWNTGLQKIDRYTGEAVAYLSPGSGSGMMHIHSITEYAPGMLLIGSDDGLSLFNTLTGEETRFLPEETNPHSLSNRFIYPIMKDREGGLWIGTYYGGVNYVSPRTGQFESFVHTKYANSVSGNIISRFSEDKYGNIWIGSDDGGLNCYSPQTGKFTHYVPKDGQNSLSYHNVHALCFDDDDLWIGTYSGGLNVLDTKTGRFRLYTASQGENSIDQNSIYMIFRDRDKNMWVTSMAGINLYDREKDRFIYMKEPGSVTMDIKQDGAGDLWFATQGKGVFRYSPATQQWKNYLHGEEENDLPGNVVNCVHVNSLGEVWFGTTEGLCKYDSREDCFQQINLGVPNRHIACIIEEEGYYWITTNKGLIRYKPGEPALVFSQTDGLQSEHFLAGSGIKASTGKIYVGSVHGFTAFYPHRIRPNTFVPPVVFTGLEVFNKEIPVSEDGILPASLDGLEELHLSHRDNVFGIRYAGLSYSIPEKNNYTYMLEGFDKEWNYVGTQHKATYTNLPAGSYTFRVKASNNDGIWNETGAALAIVIHPPFYLTTGFKVLYSILFGLGILFLYRFFMKRAEKKHTLEIEELNRRKEKDMHEAKIGFFTMIAHEIRTPVSLIIGPLEKIMTSEPGEISEAVREDLNVIDRNSQRLLFLMNQLLDFRKVENGGFKMKFGRYNMAELIRAVSIRFKPWVTRRGVQFTVNYPEEKAVAVVDREALTKLISNLLTNANKYTRDEIILSCTFASDNRTFTITVTDNGCGIKEEDREKIFRPFYQAKDNKPGTGIGLSIVHNIVDAHSGKIEVVSEPDKGASFIVTLPIEHPETEYANEPEEEKTNDSLPEDILPAFSGEKNVKARPVMLIADDNDEMLRFLSNSFKQEYTILTAEDGEEALLKLTQQEVNLIVSDWMMPKMNGVELCKAVRADRVISHIPFVLLTAKTDVHSKIEGMDCGADSYIEKPFSLQYLKSCIKNLLDLREMLYHKFSNMPLVPLKSIAGNRADEEFLSRMNEIIEENFSNPDLSVDFLADKLFISRSGLFAKIKTLANVTPNELIQVVRLKKAAGLLSENKYRINEISYMVGFNNPSYFSKCFQKQFGMKPGEFLKRGEISEPEG